METTVYGDLFSLFTFLFSLHRWKMAEKRRFTFDERIKTVMFLNETKSVLLTLRRFREYFLTRSSNSFKKIKRIYEQFNSDGSVHDG